MIRSYLERRTRADFLRHLLEAHGVALGDGTINELRTRYDIDLDSISSIVPLEVFLQLTKYMHDRFYYSKTYDEACELMGYKTAAHYLESQFGRVLKITSKIVGFEKSSQNFANSLKTIFPNATVSVEFANSVTYRVRLSGVSVPPAFVKGLMGGGVAAVFGLADRVEVVVFSAHDFTCQCWRSAD
jgi:uncharacterized protein (TIGR02265 family)